MAKVSTESCHPKSESKSFGTYVRACSNSVTHCADSVLAAAENDVKGLMRLQANKVLILVEAVRTQGGDCWVYQSICFGVIQAE